MAKLNASQAFARQQENPQLNGRWQTVAAVPSVISAGATHLPEDKSVEPAETKEKFAVAADASKKPAAIYTPVYAEQQQQRRMHPLHIQQQTEQQLQQ